MLLIHVNWTDREGGRLIVWGESSRRFSAFARAADGATSALASDGSASGGVAVEARTTEHPFAASEAEVRDAVGRWCASCSTNGESAAVELMLPGVAGVPTPSPTVSHVAGHSVAEDEGAGVELLTVSAPAISLDAAAALRLLSAFEELDLGVDDHTSTGRDVALGASAIFFSEVLAFVRHLVSQQRVVPGALQDGHGRIVGAWQPWLADGPTVERALGLLRAMPGSARAAVDGLGGDGWRVLEGCVYWLTDALCRRGLMREGMADALDGRDAQADAHVAWLSGLLGTERDVPASYHQRPEMLRQIGRWLGRLEERAATHQWRLRLRVDEPVDVGGLLDFQTPGDGVNWSVVFELQSVEQPGVVVEASEIWLLPAGAATVKGRRLESPQDVLLGELGRAARLYKGIDEAMKENRPRGMELTTAEVYRFLREVKPILEEQGIGVEVPPWWESPTVRLGARLQLASDPIDTDSDGTGSPSANVRHLGLSSLVTYQWKLAIGQHVLTLDQFEKLAGLRSPLVRLGGTWVEVRPDDVRSALKFLQENPGGTIEVGRAMRLAFENDPKQTGLPIVGMDATGWVASVFGDPSRNETLPMLESPSGFVGTLRNYQLKGFSWLAFLDRFGLGACLADDMGLGKTIQLLALLAHERSAPKPPADDATQTTDAPSSPPMVDATTDATRVEAPTGPTLLIAPMSVVTNWRHEARRFTPSLRVLVHHGPERAQGEGLVQLVMQHDLVVTTYALAHRDHADLARVGWGRVVLDEAQNIKNPGAKQAMAVRSLDAPRRIALTGTPVENRLGELWSIMDFLNPGFLGTAGEFRRRFAIPIERHHEARRASQLRGFVKPFILRRLKSDPTVLPDLPDKLESTEFCYLTPEQAGLYETCVRDMLQAAERAEGMQRRGAVLAGLIRLKQVCNHPSQFLKDSAHLNGSSEGEAPSAVRSGKCQRLIEMLEEIVASGDQALVFTQFRQMGHLLAAMLRQELDREVLFLHGGTPSAQREQLVASFQKADGSSPIFILSLKAGGLGLNLTAANHVFHFDRWWNPAVEAQATDRAYRIGQSRTVHVHKFVVSGTLEERIDEMLKQKTHLADLVIASGERGLTELSTSQLRDLLTLRPGAVGDDA